MHRKIVFLAAGVLAAAMTPALAHAATCPTRESLFGTVQRVQNRTLTIRANSGQWATVMLDGGARVNANGFPLRPGAYVGAYGCVTPNGVFHASQITLARNRSLYGKTIAGVVQRIENGRLVVNEPAEHTTGYWYVPNPGAFRVGQRIVGTGMLGSAGAFYPQRIGSTTTAVNLSAQPGAVTLQGRVQRVYSNRLVVWEPARRTSGTWIVPNAGAFRVGQTVTATGFERNGYFYPSSIR